MARLYCTPDDVKQYLPSNISVEGSPIVSDYMNPEQPTVEQVDVDFFISQASRYIDGFLRTIYHVPLKMVNQGGTLSYPDPIGPIAALLAAQMIYEQKLQGTDRARSESQKEREKRALQTLASIQNGELLLEGVKVKGQRFVSATLMNAPKNPAEGGRTKID